MPGTIQILSYYAFPRRRPLRALATITLAMAITFGGWRYLPPVWRQGQYLLLQHRCMTHPVAARTIAYDDGPDAFRLLNKQRGEYRVIYGYSAGDGAGLPTPVSYCPADGLEI